MNTINRLFPLIKKKRFYNDTHDSPENFFLHTVPSFVRSLAGRKKIQLGNKDEWVVTQPPLETSREPVVTWIGHATFLVQIGGLNILTDPIFGSPSFLFPRMMPPGIALQQLPKIDYVLLSHNHLDHCDMPTLRQLLKRFPNMELLVPQGDKGWLQAAGFPAVTECMWWQQQGPFTFLPARHWSQNGFFDANKSLWGSWMISYGNHTIYFAGDTAYSNHFSAIAEEFKNITVALMPIGPCEPNPAMRRSHVDSHEAVQGFIDLRAKHFVPMHWGTFPFGTDHFHTPLEWLHDAWQQQETALKDKTLHVPKFGTQITF